MGAEDTAATVVADEPVSVSDAVNNASNDVNEHTPNPPPVPVVDAVPDVVPSPVDASDKLEALSEAVAVLASGFETIKELVMAKVIDGDDGPAPRPWTHVGSKR